MKQIGLIGAGNMGEAILRGMISGGFLKAAQITVCDASAERMEELAQNALYKSVTYCDSPIDLVEACDMVILAVKPHQLRPILQDVQSVSNGKAFLSIVAGWTCDRLKHALSAHGASYLRAMPNTPAMVGEGMTALCREHQRMILILPRRSLIRLAKLLFCQKACLMDQLPYVVQALLMCTL